MISGNLTNGTKKKCCVNNLVEIENKTNDECRKKIKTYAKQAK